jgi:long-subunit fatty acid transport protein
MRSIVFSLLLFPFVGLSQNSTVFQIWNEVSVGYKLDKKQSLGVELTTRHGAGGLQTFFPQISYKYKINKFIRPSVDYRYVGSSTQEGNFSYRHRINTNLQFNYEIERLELGLRMRYQFTTNRLADNFEQEFGEAFRIKPSVSYDIKKSVLLPQASMEFFTGPMDGQQGYHLNRIRWSVGLGFDWDGPHSLELAYLYDQRIMSPGSLNRAILNFSYGYSITSKKAKKPVPKQRTGRFL